jgi:hypothetical protein
MPGRSLLPSARSLDAKKAELDVLVKKFNKDCCRIPPGRLLPTTCRRSNIDNSKQRVIY